MDHPFKTLLATLGNRKECYIQSHDFPDHDSIASAYGLAILLRFRGIEAKLIYEGTIQRDTLKLLMEELRIPIRHSSEQELNETDAIIIVDGCKGNKNVTDLIGDEIGVIDHHNVDTPEAVPFCDIRPGYGSCSTIIYEYYRDSGIEIPGSVATALMVGLLVDTAQMTRGVCDADVEAYPQLYRAGGYLLRKRPVKEHHSAEGSRLLPGGPQQGPDRGGHRLLLFSRGVQAEPARNHRRLLPLPERGRVRLPGSQERQ